MKTFVVLILTVVALFVWQHGNNPGQMNAQNPATKLIASPPPRPLAGQNWVKNSLDRTHEAIEQVSRLRAEEGRP
jgi:hypothetical protein